MNLTEPLFADLIHVPLPRRPRPAAYGLCPKCRGRGKRTGLMRQGKHLAWRQHSYTTWTGARMTCQASGVLLCQLPARAGGAAPKCSCHA